MIPSDIPKKNNSQEETNKLPAITAESVAKVPQPPQNKTESMLTMKPVKVVRLSAVLVIDEKNIYGTDEDYSVDEPNMRSIKINLTLPESFFQPLDVHVDIPEDYYKPSLIQTDVTELEVPIQVKGHSGNVTIHQEIKESVFGNIIGILKSKIFKQ